MNPQPYQSEQEIADIAANKLMFADGRRAVTYPWALLFPGSSTFPGGPILPSYPIQVTPALITVDGVDIGVNRGDVTLTFTDLKGWFDGPGSRSSFVDRPNDHGSFDGPVYRSNRVISIEGAAYADSRSAVAAALHVITGILAEGEIGPLTVADPDYGTLTAMVRLTDGPSIIWNSARQQWTFQIQFTAPILASTRPRLTWPTGLPAAAARRPGVPAVRRDGAARVRSGRHDRSGHDGQPGYGRRLRAVHGRRPGPWRRRAHRGQQRPVDRVGS
jgi:hypothetical protein